MRLSGAYSKMKVYAVVYHTQSYSEEVEFVREKIFSSAKKAKKWFHRKFEAKHFIQPEVVMLSGLNTCTVHALDVSDETSLGPGYDFDND